MKQLCKDRCDWPNCTLDGCVTRGEPRDGKDTYHIVLVSESEAKLVMKLPEKSRFIPDYDNFEKYNKLCQRAIDSSPFVKNFELARQLLYARHNFGNSLVYNHPYLVDLSEYEVSKPVKYWKTLSGGDDWTKVGKGWSINNAHRCRKFVTISPKQDSAHTEGMRDQMVTVLKQMGFDAVKTEDINPLPTEGQTNSDRLKSLLISTYRKFGSEKALVHKGQKVFTGDQLADEIQNETDTGIEIFESIVRLTIDLLKRDKINLPEVQSETQEDLWLEARTFMKVVNNNGSNSISMIPEELLARYILTRKKP